MAELSRAQKFTPIYPQWDTIIILNPALTPTEIDSRRLQPNTQNRIGASTRRRLPAVVRMAGLIASVRDVEGADSAGNRVANHETQARRARRDAHWKLKNNGRRSRRIDLSHIL